MKTKKLITAFFICLCAISSKAQTNNKDEKSISKDQEWTFSNQLDAVIAAPKNHMIVYEDSDVRILKVICPPGNEEPIHTHQYKSTMWFTQSAHFIYYTYVMDSNNRLVKKDSVEVKGFPTEALNKGQMVGSEPPHSIKNIGADTLVAYRIEYKKDFKK